MSFGLDEKLKQKIRQWRGNPVRFTEDNFNATPIPWQEKAMEEVSNNNHVAIKAGRHTGKTFTLADITLWYLTTHFPAKVVCTAPTQDQLSSILWPEISELYYRSGLLRSMFEITGKKIQLREAPRRHFAVARTATKRENLQGFNSPNILILCDEASGLDAELVDAIRGSLFSEDAMWVMAGNPTKVSGRFFDIWDKGYGNFTKFTIDSRKCELTDDDKVAQLEKDHPPGTAKHNMYIKGEFPRTNTHSFIRRELVERGIENDDFDPADSLHFGIDVARSGDNQTVIASRMSQKVLEINKTSTVDVMESSDFCIRQINRLRDAWSNEIGLEKDELDVFVKVDDAGVGGGVTDRLKQEYANSMTINIVPVNPGENPYDDRLKDMYDNAATASWAEVRERLQDDDCNLPDNEKLTEQLSKRKYIMLKSGRSKLQAKRKMEEKSPDEADAVCLAYYGKGTQSYEYNDVMPVSFTKKNDFAF